MVETDMVVREGVALTPREEVLGAKEIANALVDMVRQTGAVQNIQGKEYLQVEAWQFIGARHKVSVVPTTVEEVYNEDGTLAYKAEVRLMQDGIIVGGAFSFCGLDEFVAQGKRGWAARNAAASMAQTRAASKALRIKYSWIAMLAGYQPTPAEEMQSERTNTRPSGSAPHGICPQHNVPWAQMKRGNSQWLSHRQNGGWCNERDAPSTSRPTEQQPVCATCGQPGHVAIECPQTDQSGRTEVIE